MPQLHLQERGKSNVADVVGVHAVKNREGQEGCKRFFCFFEFLFAKVGHHFLTGCAAEIVRVGHAGQVVVTVLNRLAIDRHDALHASELSVEVEVTLFQRIVIFHVSEYGEKRAAHKFFFDYFFGQFSCQVIFFVQLARNFFSFFCLTKFDRARPGPPPVKSFFIFFSIFFSRLFGAACQTSRLFSLAFATDFFFLRVYAHGLLSRA